MKPEVLRRKFVLAILIIAVCSSASTVWAQQTAPAKAAATTAIAEAVDPRAEAVMKKAVARLGGERYLAVRTAVGRGFYAPMQEIAIGKQTGGLQSFTDYLAYPDRERTEFKTGGIRTIQTNTPSASWIYDGALRSLKDQTPVEIANFQQAIRTSLDYFLRGEWRKDNARLEYVGRREAGVGRRNEVVRLVYPDELAVEYEFAATDATPMKTVYTRKNADGEPTKEEDRFAQWIEVNGVFAPFIVDHYRNGKQTSRVNYQTVEFNTPIADALFAKPVDAKKVK